MSRVQEIKRRQPSASSGKKSVAERAGNKETLQAQLATLGTPSIDHYLGGPWHMHLPFAYHLVRALNPRVFVELGVYKGESYFAFCQSVQENNLVTECYGVDTWHGDPHSGFYSSEIAEEVAEHNRRYASFSHLLAITFKEAERQFHDRSIDLLHIDGAHRYEDVRGDFEMWRPKLSENAIVLFHDVMERDLDFGVFRLWEEIARPGASFLFEFGHGLGIWKAAPVTNDDPPFLRRLFAVNAHDRGLINRHYASMAKEVEASSAARPNFLEDRSVPTYLHFFSVRNGDKWEEQSSLIEILPGRWCRPKIDLPWGIGDGSAPFRFDPVNRPAVVDIASVTLRSSATREILWRANREGGLEELIIRGTALRLPHERLLRLLSYADDPQIYLPHLTGDIFEEPLTLEVLLRFDPSPESIERAVSSWNVRAITASGISAPAVPSLPPSFASQELVPPQALDDQISLVVYSAGESGYSEDRSTRVPYARDRWSHLDIALQLGLGSLPLRLDPLTTIGLIDVASLTIRSAINDEVLWCANGGGDLEALHISGSAVRIPHSYLVRILSYGKDPQIYLPSFPEGKFNGPLRLEVWLKTETDREPIRRGISELAAIAAQAVATTSETQTSLEQSNRAVSDKEAEMEALRLAREAGREREAALGEMVDSLKEQLASLKSELAAQTSQFAETKKQAEQVR